MKVLFVCLGNICRSPTAHGVFEAMLHSEGLAGQVSVDSAGTAAWHVGSAPDPRSCEFAARRGYDLSPLRARQVSAADFSHFDYVLAMDRANLVELEKIQPPHSRAHLGLFLEFAPPSRSVDEVPDPYYGGTRGFEEVLDLVEEASAGLIRELQRRLDTCR